MLGLARADVGVHCWDGDDEVRSTQVHLNITLAEVPTDKMHQWLAYLDAFGIGRVKVWTNRLQSDITIPQS